MILPTPEANPRLEGELPEYIHSSGAFQTFKPAGSDWHVDELADPLGHVNRARRDPEQQPFGRDYNYLQPGVVYEFLQDLSDTYLTNAYFTSAWQDYDSWEITGREITERAVIVNFNLRSNGNDYLGRDITRLDGTTLYVTRLVVPANNPPLLEKLAGLVTATFTGYPGAVGASTGVARLPRPVARLYLEVPGRVDPGRRWTRPPSHIHRPSR